jgi:NAD(P)-dependent dehydrogenase (short-subunit alcohol dehydrogenase family)
MTAERSSASPNRLDGRTALVTGGANGMGREIADRLAREGARVVIADIGAPGERLANGDSVYVQTDVTSEESVGKLRSEVEQHGLAVDILVNAVGIYPQASLADTSLELWEKLFSVNCVSMFLVSRAFVPPMAERGWGRVINVASNSFHGGQLPNYSAYIASKGCVIGLTRGLATDFGEFGVTVNALAPGLVKTPSMVSQRDESLFEEVAAQQSIKRSQEPDDVAGAAAFLASDDAAFMTGQTLVVDGGLIRV